MTFDRAEAWRAGFFAAAGVVAIIAIFWCLSAQAHWSPQFASESPTIQGWFKSQHNARGEWCCDEADGEPYLGSVTFNADGPVVLDGGRKLPAYMVLNGPNPTGKSIWWHVGETSYCFAPGTLS